MTIPPGQGFSSWAPQRDYKWYEVVWKNCVLKIHTHTYLSIYQISKGHYFSKTEKHYSVGRLLEELNSISKREIFEIQKRESSNKAWFLSILKKHETIVYISYLRCLILNMICILCICVWVGYEGETLPFLLL